jgi:hypothetical protein
MKKNLLFVMPGLDAGGGEKSLVNLLGVIDTENYNIDVVLFHKSGIFLNMLPESVNVMEIGGDYRIFAKGILPAVAFFLGTLKWRNALNRVLFVLKHKTAKNKAVAEQQSWKYVAQSIRLCRRRTMWP